MPRRDETVVIEDAQLMFRNFAGLEGMYNRAGDRNFAIRLDKELAEELANKGWNVKLLKPREDEDEPTPYLSVTVGFKGRPPTIKMIGSQSGRTTLLDESTVELLDGVDFHNVDVIVRPYDWEVNGNTGRKAYLQDLYATIIENPLELKYANMDIATVAGPMLERTEMAIDPVTGRKSVDF